MRGGCGWSDRLPAQSAYCQILIVASVRIRWSETSSSARLRVAVGDRVDDGLKILVRLLAHGVGRRLVGILSVEQHGAAVVQDALHDLHQELVLGRGEDLRVQRVDAAP